MVTGDRPGLYATVDLLHLHRLAAGWSRPALAARAGVGVDTVAAMEHHRSRPRPRTVARIAGAFGAELAGEVHRLSWCRACARAAVASFVSATWTAAPTEAGGYTLHAPARVVDVARRHGPAVVALLDLAHDRERRP